MKSLKTYILFIVAVGLVLLARISKGSGGESYGALVREEGKIIFYCPHELKLIECRCECSAIE